MNTLRLLVILASFCVLVSVPIAAQQPEPTGGVEGEVGLPSTDPARGKPVAPQASVLRLIRFSGLVRDALGTPRTGTSGITFALYAEQEGGAPLWLETQNVALDEQGRYTALLGITSNDGLPLELFTTEEARWLGIQVQGEPEQPRVLLVSVPYALKAADAETLGGKPASAFALAESTEGEAPVDDPKAQVGGSGTTNFVAKFTAATTVGNSQIFDNGTNVGVGTSSPVSITRLHASGTGLSFSVAGDDASCMGVAGVIGGTFGGGTCAGVFARSLDSRPALHVQSDSTGLLISALNFNVANNGAVRVADGSAAGAGLGFANDTDTGLFRPGSDTLAFATAGMERMRVAADGRVGVGTDNPIELLHVNGNVRLIGQTTHQVQVTGVASSGRLGQDVNGFFFASDTVGKNVRFLTSSGVLTERMRVTEIGRVGIGTMSPADLLHVAGNIRIGTGSTGCVRDADATIIAGTCSSDARLKWDIAPFPPLLNQVAQLTPVHFYWRADEYPERSLGRARSYGLIAQEVEKVLPELVKEDAQGFKAVNYSELPLVLLQAVKDLKAENDALKGQIAELQALKTDVEETKALLRQWRQQLLTQTYRSQPASFQE